MNHEIHSLSLPVDRNLICRVSRNCELPLCLYINILGAGTGDSYLYFDAKISYLNFINSEIKITLWIIAIKVGRLSPAGISLAIANKRLFHIAVHRGVEL